MEVDVFTFANRLGGRRQSSGEDLARTYATLVECKERLLETKELPAKLSAERLVNREQP